MFDRVSRQEHQEALDELADLRSELTDVREAQEDAQDWLSSVIKRRVTVHTRYDQSFEGSLSEVTPDGTILRAAKLLREEGPPTEMAGEIFIPRDIVVFVQLDG